MKIIRRGQFADKPTLEERDGTPPKVNGYAAVFYNGDQATEYRVDDVVERIMPSAFDMALQSSDVRALFNHDANQLIGRKSAGTLHLMKDQRGLSYSILLPDSPNGENVRVALQRKELTGSSFGFTVSRKGQTWSRGADGVYVREIHSIDELFDVGPVTFPAYVGTEASLRSFGNEEDFAELKRLAAATAGSGGGVSGSPPTDEEALRQAYVRAGELRKLGLNAAR